ncbi:hypothetical protein AC1031_021331 [Aphanomyces cochlioides]|nr:hypothetical protein AC1031_021331 [Aphanomyces cochlioides]
MRDMASASGPTTAIQDDVLLVDVGSLRGHELEKEVNLALLPQIEFSDEIVQLLETSKPLLLAPLQFLDGEAPAPAQRTQLAKGSIRVRQDGYPNPTALPVNPSIQQQVIQMSDDLHLSEASCLKYWILASQPENRQLVAQRNRLPKDSIQDDVPRAAREFVLQETSAVLSTLNQLFRAEIDPSVPFEKKDIIVTYTNSLLREDLVGKLIRLLTDVLPAFFKRTAVQKFAIQWQKTIAEVLFIISASVHVVPAEVKAIISLCKTYSGRLDSVRAHISSTLQSVLGLGSSVDTLPFDAKEVASLLHSLNFIQATVANTLLKDSLRYNRNTGELSQSPEPLLPSSVVQELNSLVLQDKWQPQGPKIDKFQGVIGLHYVTFLAKIQFSDPRVSSFHKEVIEANCFSFLTKALLPFAPPSKDTLATLYYAAFQDVFVHYSQHFFTSQMPSSDNAPEPALSATTTGDGIQDLMDWVTHLCKHCPPLAATCWNTPLVNTFVGKCTELSASNERARIAYMHFLAVSGEGNPAAAYKHIKDSPPPVTWKRFFSAIESYRRLLMPDSHPMGAPQGAKITTGTNLHKFSSVEVDALEAMFHIFQTMVHDEGIVHYFLDWPDVNVLLLFLGFVRCPIPSILKGAVMDTLASFVTSAPMGQLMWQHLESAQILLTAPSAPPNQGILFELEQIESMQRRYPATLGFLKLLGKVFPFEFPEDCGASYRVPGAQPYLDFVLHVFLKADGREYDVEVEKWQILEQCLLLFDQVLKTYSIIPADFKDEFVVLNPHLGFTKNDKYYNKPKTLGFTLMTKFLTDSPVLRKLFQLLTTELSVDHLESTSEATQIKYTTDLCLQLVQEVSLSSTPLISVQENCVGLALGIIHRVFQLEAQFVSSMRSSALEIVVEPLHRLLVRTPRHLVTMTNYIKYGSSSTISTLSAKLLRYLSTQLPPTPLVQLFQDHGADQDIRDGYVSVIMEESSSDAKEVVLELLVENISKPIPNISTMLLMELDANNCMDALLLVLDNLNFVHTQPRLAERAHHLLHKVVSSPALNVVGHLEGFFARQVQTLPTLLAIQHQMTAHRDILALINIRRWLLQDLALYAFQTKKINLFKSPVPTLLSVLDATSFVHVPPVMPMDDAGLKLADQCSMEQDQRLFVDIVKFQAALQADASSPLIVWALSWNRYSEHISVEAQALEAWSALVQVLVVDHHLQTKDLYQLWQAILAKSKTRDAVAHLVELLAKVSVTLSFQSRALRANNASTALSSYQRMELIQNTIELTGLTLHTTGNPTAARRARSWLYSSFLHLTRYGQEERKSDTPGREVLSHLVFVAQEPTLLDQVIWNDGFLSILCRDASEGTEPLNMGLALNVLSLILSSSSNGRISLLRHLPPAMPHLCSLFFQLCEANQDGLVDSIVSFFIQLAQTHEGALTLLRGGLLRTLMQCTTFPLQRPQWIHDMESWLAAEQTYYQKWLPILRLLAALTTSLPENTECIQAVLIFLQKHIKLISGALNLEVHYPSLQRLVETSQVALLLRTVAAHPKLLDPLLGAPKVAKLTQKLVHIVSYYGRDIGAFSGWWSNIVPRTVSEQEQADVAVSVSAPVAITSLFDQCKWDATRFLLCQSVAYCRIRMLSWDSPLKIKSDFLAIQVLESDQEWLECVKAWIALYRKELDKETALFLIENAVTVLTYHTLHTARPTVASSILSTLGSDFENCAVIHALGRKLRDMAPTELSAQQP